MYRTPSPIEYYETSRGIIRKYHNNATEDDVQHKLPNLVKSLPKLQDNINKVKDGIITRPILSKQVTTLPRNTSYQNLLSQTVSKNGVLDYFYQMQHRLNTKDPSARSSLNNFELSSPLISSMNPDIPYLKNASDHNYKENSTQNTRGSNVVRNVENNFFEAVTNENISNELCLRNSLPESTFQRPLDPLSTKLTLRKCSVEKMEITKSDCKKGEEDVIDITLSQGNDRYTMNKPPNLVEDKCLDQPILVSSSVSKIGREALSQGVPFNCADLSNNNKNSERVVNVPKNLEGVESYWNGLRDGNNLLENNFLPQNTFSKASYNDCDQVQSLYKALDVNYPIPPKTSDSNSTFDNRDSKNKFEPKPLQCSNSAVVNNDIMNQIVKRLVSELSLRDIPAPRSNLNDNFNKENMDEISKIDGNGLPRSGSRNTLTNVQPIPPLRPNDGSTSCSNCKKCSEPNGSMENGVIESDAGLSQKNIANASNLMPPNTNEGFGDLILSRPVSPFNDLEVYPLFDKSIKVYYAPALVDKERQKPDPGEEISNFDSIVSQGSEQPQCFHANQPHTQTTDDTLANLSKLFLDKEKDNVHQSDDDNYMKRTIKETELEEMTKIDSISFGSDDISCDVDELDLMIDRLKAYNHTYRILLNQNIQRVKSLSQECDLEDERYKENFKTFQARNELNRTRRLQEY